MRNIIAADPPYAELEAMVSSCTELRSMLYHTTLYLYYVYSPGLQNSQPSISQPHIRCQHCFVSLAFLPWVRQPDSRCCIARQVARLVPTCQWSRSLLPRRRINSSAAQSSSDTMEESWISFWWNEPYM